MSKGNTTLMVAAGLALVGYFLYQKSTAAAGAFSAAQSVILYPPNNLPSLTVNYGALTGQPSIGGTFTYNGVTYTLQQDAAGNLYAMA